MDFPLEADVASAWKRDPVLNQKMEGTNSVGEHIAQLIRGEQTRLVRTATEYVLM